MRWPLDNFTITTYYNPDHQAYDLAAPEGTPALATVSGVVKSVGTDPNYIGGRYIIIRSDEDGFGHYTGHFSSTNVSVGQRVSKGQEIARVGHTGQATGPHIHFQVRDLNNNLVAQSYYASLFKEPGMPYPSISTMRIIQTEVTGSDYDFVHSGKFDKQLQDAWGTVDVNEFVYKMFAGADGSNYRALKESWKARPTQEAYDLVAAQLSELTKTVKIKDGVISDLTKQNNALKAQVGDSNLTIKQALRVLAQAIKEAIKG